MSVLIKGMKMPTSCSECALNYDCFKCIVTETPFFDHEHNFDDETTRLNNCPLIEIPLHGRLIDADKLKEEFPHDEDWDYPVNTNSYVVETIDKSPTIIETEEGE